MSRPLSEDDAAARRKDENGSWGVIVMCDTEQQQIELLQRMIDEGRVVRALIK
jgi:hypothetical protein